MAKLISNGAEINEESLLIKKYESEIIVSDNTIFDNFIRKYGESLLKNIDLYLKYVHDWINRNISVLGSKHLGERINFYPYDEKALFDIFGIDKLYIKALTNKSTYVEKNWTISIEPINVLMYIMIFFYYDKQDFFKKLDYLKNIQPYKIANFLLSARFFSTIIIRQFKYVPDQAIMFYTLETLTNKYIISKMNSLYEMIEYIASTNIEAWEGNGKINSRSDVDLDSYMRKMNTRISSSIINIAEEFYKNHKDNKKIYTETNTLVNDEGKTEMVNTTNISNTVSQVTNRIISNLYMDSNVDTKFVRIASNKTGSSYTSLLKTIQEIQRDRDIDVEVIIKNIISYFLVTEKQPATMINSATFFEIMITSYKVANTNNQYILEIKRGLNDLLEKYNDLYRATNRKNTKSNLRSGLYLYIILYITKLN